MRLSREVELRRQAVSGQVKSSQVGEARSQRARHFIKLMTGLVPWSGCLSTSPNPVARRSARGRQGREGHTTHGSRLAEQANLHRLLKWYAKPSERA